MDTAIHLKSMWIERESITAVFRHRHGEHATAMKSIAEHFNDYDVHFIRGDDDKTHLCMIARKAIA